MKKVFTKITSLLLVLIMVFTMLPLSVFAVTPTESPTTTGPGANTESGGYKYTPTTMLPMNVFADDSLHNGLSVVSSEKILTQALESFCDLC